jgi:hypothetical protein
LYSVDYSTRHGKLGESGNDKPKPNPFEYPPETAGIDDAKEGDREGDNMAGVVYPSPPILEYDRRRTRPKLI